MAKQQSSKARIADLLKQVPLLSTCSKKELSLLSGIADEMEFGAGETIFKEGDEGLGLQIVMEGETKVLINGRTRRKMGEGSFFGEIALLDGGPRTATVVAETDVRTLSIPAWSFNAVLKEQPSIALKMLPELAHRLRTSDPQT